MLFDFDELCGAVDDRAPPIKPRWPLPLPPLRVVLLYEGVDAPLGELVRAMATPPPGPMLPRIPLNGGITLRSRAPPVNGAAGAPGPYVLALALM